MGRYYKKLKKYDNAETYFKKAKIIYEAMLADKIAGKKGTYEEISRNAELGTVLVGDEYLRGTVRFINISDPNTGVTYRNLIRNDDSFSLINDSIPEFMIGYAGLLQSAEILKPEEAITFTEEDLNKTVKGMLKDSSDMLKSAENEYENEFIPKYLRFNKPRAEIMDEIRSKRMRKIELSEKEFIVERIELKLQTSKIRLGLAKANYLFEVAKVIRTKNFDFANKIIGDAIKITGDVLEGNIPNRPPQEIISALLTLAWGYSSKAALLEDEEKNKGIQYATAAAGIYKAILHGFDSLDPEMMKALSDIAKTSIYGKVKNYIENDCDFISRSLKNVMNGGGNIWWHGTLPQIIGPADVDVLAILTNNELELSLTYAGNLSSAGRYEEALIEYDNLLGVEKRLNSKINNSLHETFWARVRSAKANALTRIANEDFITRNYKEAGEKLIEAERLTKESLNSLEGTIKGIKNAIKRPGAILTDVPEEYYTEMVRSADTLGWIYGIRGRIDKELNGTRKKYFEKAKKIYEAIHIYSKTEAAPTDNDPEFNHLLTFISETTSGLSNEKLLDIQFETNFTDSHLRLKRADSYKDLKEYDLAIGTYSEIQKGNILHMKAQVGMQEARIEKVKEELKIDGDKEKALNSLILNSDSVAETLRELHESTSDRMLLHRIISTA
ncbi:MAG: hypothetical protein NT030_08340, partial [Candidatus Saganbacteria bacterium]|nr:hypothetical protein [Candidatus Saganbacteria bacterium]